MRNAPHTALRKDRSQHLAALTVSHQCKVFDIENLYTYTYSSLRKLIVSESLSPVAKMKSMLTRRHWLKPGFPARVAVYEQKTRPLVLDPAICLAFEWKNRGLTRHGTIWKVRILGGRRKTKCGETIKIRSVLKRPSKSSKSKS